MSNHIDLLSMGYRPLGTNGFGVTVYAKPFGYTLLVIAIKGDDLTLAQHFKGSEDKPLVWETIAQEAMNIRFSLEQPSQGWDRRSYDGWAASTVTVVGRRW